MLHANLASLGGVKTLPYLAMFATSNLGGWFGDYLIHQRKVPTATARKLVNTVGKTWTGLPVCFTMLLAENPLGFIGQMQEHTC